MKTRHPSTWPPPTRWTCSWDLRKDQYWKICRPSWRVVVIFDTSGQSSHVPFVVPRRMNLPGCATKQDRVVMVFWVRAIDSDQAVKCRIWIYFRPTNHAYIVKSSAMMVHWLQWVHIWSFPILPGPVPRRLSLQRHEQKNMEIYPRAVNGWVRQQQPNWHVNESVN